VIGNDAGLPIPENIGDWLAILSGLAYSGGVARSEAMKISDVFPVMYAFFVFGALVAVVQPLLFGDALGPFPAAEVWVDLWPWLLLFCAVFFIPTMALITWSPQHVGTGLLSILFLAELLFGTISAAIWANEPFGWHEVLGSTLILLAGIIEVALTPKERGESGQTGT